MVAQLHGVSLAPLFVHSSQLDRLSQSSRLALAAIRLRNNQGPTDHIAPESTKTYAERYKTHLSPSASVNVNPPTFGFLVTALATTTGSANELPNPHDITVTVLNPGFARVARATTTPAASPATT